MAWLPGDIAIAHIAVNNTTAPSPPSGWTVIISGWGTSAGGGNSIAGGAAYRVLVDGDTATGLWSVGGSSPTWHGEVVIYRGQHGTPIPQAVASSAGQTGTTYDFPTLAALASSNSWGVGLLWSNGTPDFSDATPPTGMIYRAGGFSTDEVATFDTNGPISSWSSQSLTETATTHRQFMVELAAAGAGSLSFVASRFTNGSGAGTADLLLPSQDAVGQAGRVQVIMV